MNDKEFGEQVMRITSIAVMLHKNICKGSEFYDYWHAELGKSSRALLTEVCRAILDQPVAPFDLSVADILPREEPSEVET